MDRVWWDANSSCNWPCAVGRTMVYTGYAIEGNNVASRWTDCSLSDSYGPGPQYGSPGTQGWDQLVGGAFIFFDDFEFGTTAGWSDVVP